MASSSSKQAPVEEHTLIRQQKPNVLDFLSNAHYQEWIRMQKKSVRLSESILKFLIQFFMYAGETVSLIFTLVLGVLIPSKETSETVVAILLYCLSCLVTVAVGWGNKTRTITKSELSTSSTSSSSTRDNGSRLRCWWVATMFFMVLKPFRYLKLFVVRKKKLAIIRREESKITEQALQALTDLNGEELEDRRVEYHEAFCQSIPMMLLQAYFLFQKHQEFTLCDLGDLSRLTHIVLAISQAAKCAATYEAAQSDYEASLHFLSFYKSGGAHPLRIYPSDMLSLAGFANFVCHFLTILSRFYTATYFLVSSWISSAIFLISTFFVNLVIVKLFPYVFLEILENAPFGVATTASYYTERYINVFCNVGTRFNKFSGDIKVFSEKDKKKWFRVPLVLTQVLHFGASVALVKLWMGYISSGDGGHDSIISHETGSTTTLNETLSKCPEAQEWYDANDFSRWIGRSLFSTYQQLNDHFGTFNDVFSIFQMVGLLFYLQIIFTWVFSYADLRKRRRDPATVPQDEGNYFEECYPILTGYSFWGVLIDQILRGHDDTNRNNAWERAKVTNRVRKLMLLTVLGKEEFYRVTRYLWLFPRCCLSGSRCVEEAGKLANRLTETEQEVEAMIRECFKSGHPFSQRFRRMREALVLGEEGGTDVNLKDKKLFLAFFATFDLKMYTMRSDRVGRVFQLIGMGKGGCCGGGAVVRKYHLNDGGDAEMDSGVEI